MAEVPEHLLKRSAERRKALGLPVPGEEGGDAPAAERRPPTRPPETRGRSRGPAAAAAARRRRRDHRDGTKIPRTCSSGRGGARPRPPAATPAAPRRRQPARPRSHRDDRAAGAAGTGPGGHTQRLLTVVKSGSIQQTKAEAQDKVHVWPHLLVVEFASILVLTAIVLIFSAVVRRRCSASPTSTRRRTRRRRRGTSWACRSCSRCSTRWSRA